MTNTNPPTPEHPDPAEVEERDRKRAEAAKDKTFRKDGVVEVRK